MFGGGFILFDQVVVAVVAEWKLDRTVVDRRTEHEYDHADQLDPTPFRPSFAERLVRDEVEETQVDHPNCDRTKVLQDRMPNRVEEIGHVDGEDIEKKDAHEISEEKKLNLKIS